MMKQLTLIFTMLLAVACGTQTKMTKRHLDPLSHAMDKNYMLQMPKEYAEALHLTVPESRNILKFDDFIKEDNTKVGKQPAANMVKTAKDYDKAVKNGYVKLREDYIHSFIDAHERGVEPEEEE